MNSFGVYFSLIRFLSQVNKLFDLQHCCFEKFPFVAEDSCNCYFAANKTKFSGSNGNLTISAVWSLLSGPWWGTEQIWMKMMKFGWNGPPSGQTTKILLFEVLALLMHKMHENLLEKCKLISKREFTVIVVKWKKKTRHKHWKECV